MANPWAPPDPSSPPGQQGAGQPTPEQLPEMPTGASGPTPGAPTPHGPVPPAQPGPPHAPHPSPPPDPAGVASATRTAAWTAAALLASVLLVGASWPAMLGAPVAAVAGLVLAIVAVVRAARARARGPVIVLPVVLIVAALAWVAISAQTLLYVDAAQEYARCERAALTQQAQRGCATQLELDMRERLTSVLGRLGVPTPP
ncbi:hypothetical protein [Cellulomonas phragmiteti]|nr:hypothetical protein [Cellulomonas phragmiteti]